MFAVSYLDGARKDIKKMDPLWRKRVLLAIDELALNPFTKSNVKKLVSSPYFRLRVGDCRIIFDLQRSKLLILVIHIKKREDAYKNL